MPFSPSAVQSNAFSSAACYFSLDCGRKILNLHCGCALLVRVTRPFALGDLPRRRQGGLRGNPSKHMGGEEGRSSNG